MKPDYEMVIYLSLLMDRGILSIEDVKNKRDEIKDKLKFKGSGRKVKDTLDYLEELYEEGENE